MAVNDRQYLVIETLKRKLHSTKKHAAYHEDRSEKLNLLFNTLIRNRVDEIENLEKVVYKRTCDIQESNKKLQEKNIALKELLSQYKKAEEELRSQVNSNVENNILPLIRKIRTKFPRESKRFIDELENKIREITDPMSYKLSELARLTHSEIAVATKTIEGLSAKEIAAEMNIATNTVFQHRRNIREKFGIKKSRNNLRTFLTELVKERKYISSEKTA